MGKLCLYSLTRKTDIEAPLVQHIIHFLIEIEMFTSGNI